MVGTKEFAVQDVVLHPLRYSPMNAAQLVKEWFGLRWQTMEAEEKQKHLITAIDQPHKALNQLYLPIIRSHHPSP